MANTKTEETPDESKGESEEELKDTPQKTEEADDQDKKEDKESEVSSAEEATSDEASKPEEKPPELTKEDIIKIFKTFPGVGQVLAERIVEAGYESREKLISITVEDLKQLDGIGQAMAQNMADGMENAISEFEQPEKKEKADAIKEPGITSKAMGFVKGTISKITGFFKGKSPKSKSTPAKKPEPAVAGSTDKTSAEDKAAGEEEGVTEEQKAEKELAKEEEAVKETYFPEVGTTAEKPEEPSIHEEVTIEGDTGQISESSESTQVEPSTTMEPKSKPELELESEPEPKQKLQLSPALEPSQIQPSGGAEINFNNSSGLLMWFEITPNLRSEAGKLLFKAGYNNLKELKDAVVEDLTLVNGISENEAKTIYEELRRL